MLRQRVISEKQCYAAMKYIIDGGNNHVVSMPGCS